MSVPTMSTATYDALRARRRRALAARRARRALLEHGHGLTRAQATRTLARRKGAYVYPEPRKRGRR